MYTADAWSPDDQEVVALVDRAVARDAAALAELCDQYLDPVYRYVCTEPAIGPIEGFRWRANRFGRGFTLVAHNVVVDWRRREANPAQSLNDGGAA